MTQQRRLELSLFFLRIGIFTVMLMWTIDKFVRPQHAAKVFDSFYGWKGLSDLSSQLIGGLEGLLLIGFVLGFKRRVTYGLVAALHGVSTLSSYRQYFAPFEGGNLLFFAAWPMLSACVALYLLRDQDRLLTVG